VRIQLFTKIPGGGMAKLSCTGLLCLFTHCVSAGEWSGNMAVQNRYFFNQPLPENSQQHDNYLSASGEPEFYSSWDDNNQSLTFTPFLRIDQYDSERTHADIRELLWLKVFDSWQLKAGISKVFWGVTESQHLVDVINQTDNVENIDGEDKLGQPMISVSVERDWGLIDLFVLPYFRERNFPDEDGRPRTYPVVDGNNALYESSDGQNHIDLAGRLLSYLGDLEVGLSYFNGTSREPGLIVDSISNKLDPYYRLMSQFGLDAQFTTEEWLWKAEIIKRNWSAQNFLALTAGFEYTFVGVMDSSADLGLVMEYLYDDRDELATSPFENDLMTGFRYTLNDAQSTEALLGFIMDLDSHELVISLEASRRLSQHWSINLEARGFHNTNSTSYAYAFRQDGFIQIEAAYYF